ncbi:MAG: hypothetical protein VX278_16105, partial [Myxococcota bacterium]|nr:hypothetical protein [Myxococcota bacterium]
SIDLYAYSLAFMREDDTDRLYLGSFYGDPPYGSNPTQSVLSTIDENGIEIVGNISGLTGLSATTEIAGTNDGRLFVQSFGADSQFLEVDPYNGSIKQQWDLDISISGYGFTFALWDDDVWFFPSSASGYTQLYRFNIQDGSVELVRSFSETMVGAAAPTCAPSNVGG